LAQIFFYDHIKPTSVMIFITAKKNNTLTFSNNNCTILRIITSVLKIYFNFIFRDATALSGSVPS